MRTDERTDADLVAAALAGDRQGVADIYDRYATVIFTVCVRLIGNRDEAADCAAEVFLRATERLHQLREPEKLKSWLYAIARNEVARRQRQRGREVLVEAIDDLPWLATDDDVRAIDLEVTAGHTDAALVGSAVAPTSATAASGGDLVGTIGVGAMERLLQEASAGLTDRDRAVAELGLRQNLQGDELAAALGVTTNHAYVLVHRVRGRLERAITAILVARNGRDDCAELQKILAGWDGDLTVLLRKRVARHIDRCDVCGSRRKLVPAALFDAAPVLAAPIAIRQKVLAEAQVGTATGRPWSRSGFPGGSGGQRRTLWITGAAVVLAFLALLGVLAAGRDDDATLVADRASVASSDPTHATAPGTSAPGSTSVTAVLEPVIPIDDPIDLDPSTTTTTIAGVTVPTTKAPGGVVPPPQPDVIDPPSTPPAIPGFVIMNPSAIDFGDAGTVQVLSLQNAGGTPITFGLGSSSPRVTISPAGGSIAPFTSQAVTVTLDRTGLGDTFSATLTGQLGPDPAAIPVAATNLRPPTIVSATKPTRFGAVPSSVPGCTVKVVVTDNTIVTSVRVVFDNPLTPTPDDYSVLLTKGAGDLWQGELLVPTAGSITGFWSVDATDGVGQHTYQSPLPATAGSSCIP